MKTIFKLFLFITLLLVAIYFALFSSATKNYISQYIETTLIQQTNLNLSVDQFDYDLSNMDISINIPKQNTVELNSKYSIFEKTFLSNYQLNIADLSKLQNLTKIKLYNDFNNSGTIRGDLNKQYIHIESNDLLDGSLKGELVKNDLKANVTQVNISKIFNMLNYPQIYTGKIDANVSTNIKSDKIDFELDLKNGHFKENTLTILISQLLKVDITNEKFSYAKITGVKENNIITAKVKMVSPKVTISTDNLKFDISKNTIDTKLTLLIKKKSYEVDIKGDINKPKISSNMAKEIIKKKIKSKIKDKIDEKLKDKLDDEKKKVLDFLLNL